MSPRRMRIGKRLTGVSTPFGGASWETVPDVEKEVLMLLLPFLEDRRVLYNVAAVEVPRDCVESVLRIRELLVHEAGLLDDGSELRTVLRKMAGSCRRFLDRVARHQSDEPHGAPIGWGFESWVFNQALGEFRGQLGVYLQELVDRYELKLADPLAGILPPPPDSRA